MRGTPRMGPLALLLPLLTRSSPTADRPVALELGHRDAVHRRVGAEDREEEEGRGTER